MAGATPVRTMAARPMAWRKDAYLNADRNRIVCAAHGAQFDIASGVHAGPCLGQSLQRWTLVVTGTRHLHSPTGGRGDIT
jgi:nitrite reductase/ring-hydroxylating ferredoxin subunit